MHTIQIGLAKAFQTRNSHLKDDTFALISTSMFYVFYLEKKSSTNQISMRKATNNVQLEDHK